MNNPDKPDRTGSSSSSSSSDSSDSDKVRKKMKKLKKKIKKEERRTAKRLKKKLKSERKKLKKVTKSKSKEKRRSPSPVPTAPLPETVPVVTAPEKSSNVPLGLMERSMAPMTREEWEKRQAVIRKVLDEDTGRYRLIKGDGEVLEELVPLKRHKEINKHATQADGAYFLKHSHSHARR